MRKELQDEVARRALPPLKSRAEMQSILQECVYGWLPQVKFTLSAAEPIPIEKRYACGGVVHSYTELTVSVREKSHTFRVDRLLHTDGNKRPLIVYLNFHIMGASAYFPIEELSEQDVDILAFRYRDVTEDNGDFTDGIAPLLLDEAAPCGKIAMWAWAAQRVIDYALTLPGTDAGNIAVAGHSRLGKTALFCAMTDPRVKFVLSNASGCMGASLAHGNTGIAFDAPRHERGENYRDIVKNFPFWFSPNFAKYADALVSEAFDQYYLLATIAPRFVLVGSCSMDAWADPYSEQVCCAAASAAWEQDGFHGYLCDGVIEEGDASLDGHVGYFLLKSKHFMSRHGWRRYIEFMQKHADTKTEEVRNVR